MERSLKGGEGSNKWILKEKWFIGNNSENEILCQSEEAEVTATRNFKSLGTVDCV